MTTEMMPPAALPAVLATGLLVEEAVLVSLGERTALTGVPSIFDHSAYRLERRTYDDGLDYSGISGSVTVVERVPTGDRPEADLVVSRINEQVTLTWWQRLLRRTPEARHTPMIDLDVPAALLESKTPGNHHLFIDVPMSWRAYKRILKAMYRAGVIEESYYKAALRDRATYVRPHTVPEPIVAETEPADESGTVQGWSQLPDVRTVPVVSKRWGWGLIRVGAGSENQRTRYTHPTGVGAVAGVRLPGRF